MGHLINGKWTNDDVATSDKQGNYRREQSSFRHWIKPDSRFEPEPGRYHLYVSYACPWAHRTLIMRKLKGLEKIISVDVVHPDMLEHSWTFDTGFKGATGDTVNGKNYLYQIYQLSNPDVSCKVTVPVLWDKKHGEIVNNESSEIIRMLNSAFGSMASSSENYFPDNHQQEIEAMSESFYESLNNGVYRCGFAKTQSAYEKAFHELFSTLDHLNNHLRDKEYLVGETITEADIRLITTLLRFDPVYYGHFKCNLQHIWEYNNLWSYVQRMYKLDAVRETTNFAHIKRHYYYSHEFINPYRIVPLGIDMQAFMHRLEE